MSLYQVADLPLLQCAPPHLDALDEPGKDDCSRCGLWSDRVAYAGGAQTTSFTNTRRRPRYAGPVASHLRDVVPILA
jgi:hypothetical protein